MLQIIETFEQMLELLTELVTLTQGLVVVVFLQLLFTLAVAKNTQPQRKLKPDRPSLLSRIRSRLSRKKKKQLPKGDRLELTKKVEK